MVSRARVSSDPLSPAQLLTRLLGVDDEHTLALPGDLIVARSLPFPLCQQSVETSFSHLGSPSVGSPFLEASLLFSWVSASSILRLVLPVLAAAASFLPTVSLRLLYVLLAVNAIALAPKSHFRFQSCALRSRLGTRGSCRLHNPSAYPVRPTWRLHTFMRSLCRGDGAPPFSRVLPPRVSGLSQSGCCLSRLGFAALY